MSYAHPNSTSRSTKTRRKSGRCGIHSDHDQQQSDSQKIETEISGPKREVHEKMRCKRVRTNIDSFFREGLARGVRRECANSWVTARFDRHKVRWASEDQWYWRDTILCSYHLSSDCILAPTPPICTASCNWLQSRWSTIIRRTRSKFEIRQNTLFWLTFVSSKTDRYQLWFSICKQSNDSIHSLEALSLLAGFKCFCVKRLVYFDSFTSSSQW